MLVDLLAARERMVRAQVAAEVDDEIKATRPHFGDPDAAALYDRLLLALTLVIADDTEADIREAVARALTSEARCFVEGAHQRHTWSRDGIGLVCSGEKLTAPARHAGNGNAEDCPVCRPQIDKSVLYLWICPGEPTPSGGDQ